MPLLVDTFNVLHQTGVLPPAIAGVDVEGLIELIGRSRFRRHHVRLVCDGASRVTEDVELPGTMAIEFSGKGRTADDVIIHHVKRSTAPRQLTVVSSDREIQKAARKRRCTVLGSPEFLRQLASDYEKDERSREREANERPARLLRPLSPRDTTRWLNEFEVDEDDARILSDAQRDAIDAEVDKLLGKRGAKKAKLEKNEESKPTRTRARAKHAKERLRAGIKDPDRHGPPLPMDLLQEAERLWRAAQKRHGADE
jgi:predicted RNA-binding protein with PIN domain